MSRIVKSLAVAALLLFSAGARAVSFQALTPPSITPGTDWDLAIVADIAPDELSALLGGLGQDNGSGDLLQGVFVLQFTSVMLPSGVSLVSDPGEFGSAAISGLTTLNGILATPLGGVVREDLFDPSVLTVDASANVQQRSFSEFQTLAGGVSSPIALFSFRVTGVPASGASLSIDGTLIAATVDPGGPAQEPVTISFTGSPAVLTPVPEPSSTVLVAGGLVLLAAVARRAGRHSARRTVS